MTPALQSPAHGCRLRHLSALIALKPCTYTKGVFKNNFFLLQIDYIIPSVILHQAIKNAAYNAPALMLIAKTATKGVQFM